MKGFGKKIRVGSWKGQTEEDKRNTKRKLGESKNKYVSVQKIEIL